jgi:Ca2+/Na+ antiporter
MMFGLVRLALILVVALTIIYVMVSLYSRSVRKERLENEWDAAPLSADPGARDVFIAQGLADYRNSLRRRLILLVYVIPVAVISVVTYLTNTN